MVHILDFKSRKFISFLSGLAIILSFSSCGSKYLNSDPVDIPQQEDGLLWSFWLQSDSSKMFGFGPIIDGDRVVLGDLKLTEDFELDGTEKIRCYSISEKKLLWEWSDFYADDLLPATAGKLGTGIYNNKLLVFGYNSNYLIDMETGQTVWSEWFENGCQAATVWGDYIFRSSRNNIAKLCDTAFLKMANLNDMKWKSVLIMPVLDHNVPEIPIVVPEINANNDTLLYFQRRIANNYTGFLELTLECYNLTTREYVWRINPISSFSGNIYGPLVRNNLIYYNSGRELFCLNKEDGSIVWQKNLESPSYSSNYLLMADLLIYYEEDRYIKAVNAYTGTNCWSIDYFTLSPMIAVGSSILTGHEDLLILDAFSGEVTRKIQSLDPVDGVVRNSFFAQPPVVDEAKNIVYIADNFRLRCYDLTKLLSKQQ